MAQLKIIEKGDCLTHAHLPICLETDIGYGPSGQYYSHYVLCDDIQPWCPYKKYWYLVDNDSWNNHKETKTNKAVSLHIDLIF